MSSSLIGRGPRGLKRFIGTIVGVALAACVIPAPALAAETTELEKVQGLYPNASIVESTNDTFYDDLKQAKKTATESSPIIIHATGSINSSAKEIPANVILVGEGSTTYNFCGEDKAGQNVFRLYGSIYGGTIKGKNNNDDIRINGATGSSVNGTIEDVSFIGGKYAVTAYGGASGIKIKSCSVNKTTDCGFQAVNGSTYEIITNCKITDCGESGIDLIYANATTITNNTIKGSKGHGISTDTDTKLSEKRQNGCNIGAIENNTISGSAYHGIYVEYGCTIDSITNNKIFKNVAGINVGAGGTVKSIAKNKIYSNTKSNIIASGKAAKATLGASNNLYKSKEHGISASQGGTIVIKGANNKIHDNSKSGINLMTTSLKTQVTISGANTKIYKSGKSNISVTGKNAIFKATKAIQSYSAKAHGVSITAGKVTLSGAKTIIKNNGENGVNIGRAGKLTMKGSGSKITGSGKNGISMNNKATASIKGTKFSGNKKNAVYVGVGCKFTYKASNISKSAKAKNRLYIAK